MATLNLDLTLNFSSRWSGDLVYTLTDVIYEGLGDLSAAELNEDAMTTASGVVTVAGGDAFSAGLSIENFGQCAEEFDVVTQTLEGSLEILHFESGGKECDGCTDWSSDNHQGTYCR